MTTALLHMTHRTRISSRITSAQLFFLRLCFNKGTGELEREPFHFTLHETASLGGRYELEWSWIRIRGSFPQFLNPRSCARGDPMEGTGSPRETRAGFSNYR